MSSTTITTHLAMSADASDPVKPLPLLQRPMRSQVSTCLAEIMGSFILSTVVLTASTGTQTYVYGFALVALVYATNHLSESTNYYNPAATVAAALSGHLEWGAAAFYVVEQVFGALLAGCIMYGVVADHNTPVAAIGTGTSNGNAFLLEFLASWAFVAVALASRGAPSDERHGLAVGLFTIGAASMTHPYTGGFFNPAIGCLNIIKGASVGDVFWLWILAPLVGAVAAVAWNKVAEAAELQAPLAGRCLHELFGTFWWALAVAMKPSDGPFVVGAVVAGMAMAWHTKSGAHFNPVTTLTHLWRHGGHKTRMEPSGIVAYCATQIVGVFLAGAVATAVLGAADKVGHAAIGAAYTENFTTFVAEIIATFVFMWVYCHASDRPSHFGPAVGLAVFFVTSCFGGITGAPVNPALTMLAVVAGESYSAWWLWWIGSIAGAQLAAAGYEWCKDAVAAGKGATTAETEVPTTSSSRVEASAADDAV